MIGPWIEKKLGGTPGMELTWVMKECARVVEEDSYVASMALRIDWEEGFSK